MSKTRDIWTNQQIETIIGNLLRGGVMLAAVVSFVGGVLYLLHYGGTLPDYRIFRGEPTDLRTLHGIALDVLSFRSRD